MRSWAAWWAEAKRELPEWWAIAWPVCLTNLCRTGMTLTDVSVLGHLGTDYLKAASLGGVWSSMAFVIVNQGFVSALSTLCAQAYGAGNRPLVGAWLQMGLSLSVVACVPVGATFFFAGDIMNALVGGARFIAPSTVHNVNLFGSVMAAALVPSTVYACVNQYLVTQKIVFPQLLANAVFVGINVGFNYAFIYGAKLGFVGSPLATAASKWGLALFTCWYVFVYKKYHRTTGTWPARCVWRGGPGGGGRGRRGGKRRTESASDEEAMGIVPATKRLADGGGGGGEGADRRRSRVRAYLKQALPLALGGALEDWQLQVIGVFAARIRDHERSMATHNAIFQVFWFLSSFMWSVTNATRVRIGHHLGAGDVRRAKLVMQLAVVVGGGVGACVALFWVLGRRVVGHLYSEDPRIWALSTKVAAIVGVGYALLSLFYAAMATLSAQGRPGWVAAAFFTGAWVVCIPLAWVLTFDVPSIGTPLVGLWLAMTAGYLTVTAVAWVGVIRTDWPAVAIAARERSEARAVNVDEGGGGGGGGGTEGALDEPLLNPAAAAGGDAGDEPPGYGSIVDPGSADVI